MVRRYDQETATEEWPKNDREGGTIRHHRKERQVLIRKARPSARRRSTSMRSWAARAHRSDLQLREIIAQIIAMRKRVVRASAKRMDQED